MPGMMGPGGPGGGPHGGPRGGGFHEPLPPRRSIMCYPRMGYGYGHSYLGTGISSFIGAALGTTVANNVSNKKNQNSNSNNNNNYYEVFSYCPNCGTKRNGNNTVCSNCGTSLIK